MCIWPPRVTIIYYNSADLFQISSMLLYAEKEATGRYLWGAVVVCGGAHAQVLEHIYLPYSLDQTPWLLFISSPEFVRRLFESGVY